MEAMAAGLPIVATEVGGTGELVRGRVGITPPVTGPQMSGGGHELGTVGALNETFLSVSGATRCEPGRVGQQRPGRRTNGILRCPDRRRQGPPGENEREW